MTVYGYYNYHSPLKYFFFLSQIYIYMLGALHIGGHGCWGCHSWHKTLLLNVQPVYQLESFQVQNLCPQMWSAPSSHVTQCGVPPAAMSPNLERTQQLCRPMCGASSAGVSPMVLIQGSHLNFGGLQLNTFISQFFWDCNHHDQ